jgi:hypothetical protein
MGKKELGTWDVRMKDSLYGYDYLGTRIPLDDFFDFEALTCRTLLPSPESK